MIWGNRLKAGEYKYIGGFPHFVADAGEERVGRWLDERIELDRVDAEIWKDAAPSHLVDIAVFCDSDDTHTASISYFGPYNPVFSVGISNVVIFGPQPGLP